MPPNGAYLLIGVLTDEMVRVIGFSVGGGISNGVYQLQDVRIQDRVPHTQASTRRLRRRRRGNSGSDNCLYARYYHTNYNHY